MPGYFRQCPGMSDNARSVPWSNPEGRSSTATAAMGFRRVSLPFFLFERVWEHRLFCALAFHPIRSILCCVLARCRVADNPVKRNDVVSDNPGWSIGRFPSAWRWGLEPGWSVSHNAT